MFRISTTADTSGLGSMSISQLVFASTIPTMPRQSIHLSFVVLAARLGALEAGVGLVLFKKRWRLNAFRGISHEA